MHVLHGITFKFGLRLCGTSMCNEIKRVHKYIQGRLREDDRKEQFEHKMSSTLLNIDQIFHFLTFYFEG